MGRRGRPRHPELLTPREQEVLQHLRDGLTNEEIAERLGVSFNTAKTHVATILSKLGVSTREEAAAWRGEVPAQRRWIFPRAILALGGAGLVGSAIAGVAILTWGVVSVGGDDATDADVRDGADGASTETTDPTPQQSVIIGSPEEAIARAHHDSKGLYGSADASETTAEHMLAAEAAELLELSGLAPLPLMPDDYVCPDGAECPAPGAPKNEPGYLVITRASNGEPITEHNPEKVLVSWISDGGNNLGFQPAGVLREQCGTRVLPLR